MRACELRLSLLALLAASAPVVAQTAPLARQVAAPAADILDGTVRLPDPSAAAHLSRGWFERLAFRTGAAGDVSLHEVVVERDGALEFAFLAADCAAWRVQLRGTVGGWRDVDADFGCERDVSGAGDDLPGMIVDRRRLRGLPVGRWTLRIEAPRGRGTADAWFACASGGDARLVAWLDGWRVVAGETPPLLARVEGARAVRVEALLEGQGWSTRVPLHDDGLHGDGAAGDGTHGAELPPQATGRVQARVEALGAAERGEAFARSVPLSFVVEAPLLELSKRLDSRAQPDGRLALELEARFVAPARRVLAAAEVWARDAGGASVPVCWLARIVDPRPVGRDSSVRGAAGLHVLPLELDLRWLEHAAVRGPLELRSVRVQDPDSFVVLAEADLVPVAARVPDSTARAPRPATPQMLQGAAFAAAAGWSPAGPHAPAAPQLLRPGLLLSHGYCSSGAIWPDADFQQPKLAFVDANANRSHDQFAQRLAQAAQAAGLTSFGIVGHSQGGAAALHLRTYYSSPLDRSNGPRRIQAVATPWLGTPLASLGFFACGTNDNMTPSGAAAWLANIPNWARAEVHCWTVADNGGSCNFFTSLLLSDPEDGTVERARGELPGGVLMGHAPGWCHTTGMSHPACYHDHARNAQMDAQAAR